MRSRRARGLWESPRRLIRYRLMIPVLRSVHPAEYTARGVANGVFWGLTPTVGLQTLEIVATWFLGRRVFHRDSSLLQALIWAWVNNPLTMIPMYYAFYVTGLWMVGQRGRGHGYDAFVAVFAANAALSWWTRLGAIVEAIGVPIFAGCLPYAVAGAALSYRWTLGVIRRRRLRMARFGEAV